MWYGAPVDPDNDGWLNFKGDWEVNQLAVAEGDPIFAVMRWDDDWGQADCDLDLDLTRWDETASAWVTVVRDDRPQNGGAGKVPLAWVELDRSVDAYYALSILKNTCTSAPAWIQLIAWSPVIGLQYPSPSHHMGNPEESRNPGMLAVGAAHYWNTNVIASYSSRGPTVDGRIKPDITGVACGQTSISSPATVGDSQCWFPGTSQSAPHVAGMAALVKQRFPNYRPSLVTHYLEQNAAERGSVGADNTWGYGLATLPDPNAAPTLIKAAPASNITAVNGGNTGGGDHLLGCGCRRDPLSDRLREHGARLPKGKSQQHRQLAGGVPVLRRGGPERRSRPPHLCVPGIAGRRLSRLCSVDQQLPIRATHVAGRSTLLAIPDHHGSRWSLPCLRGRQLKNTSRAAVRDSRPAGTIYWSKLGTNLNVHTP